MQPPPTPADEPARQESLRATNLLGTPADVDLDRITRLAASHFQVPIALLSLIDNERQWFKSREGLEVPETPRSHSFCGHAILGEDVFIVEDATKDERFHDNPLVAGEPNIAFYAGMPIRGPGGHRIGTLCILDREPQEFGPDRSARLADFARLMEVVIERRSIGETQARLLAELDEARRDAFLCPLTQLWNRRGFSDLLSREVTRARRSGQGIGLALVDMDHLKRVNDTHGHLVGNRALVRFAAALREAVRRDDIVARIGGDEFAVVMPNLDAAGLCPLSERLVQAIRRDARLVGEPAINLTASIGAVFFPAHEPALDEETMVGLADGALYAAKAAGRDRVAIADAPRRATAAR